MTNLRNVIVSGLATLLAGCASTYAVKEEAPVRTAETSPAAEMAVDADVTERTSYPTPFTQMFHSLDQETSLVVTYTTSHPLIIQNVRAKAMVIPQGMQELYAKMKGIGAFSEKEALQTYTCRGRINDNGYFVIADCDKELPEGISKRLEIKVL